jgi:hypothetical protein
LTQTRIFIGDRNNRTTQYSARATSAAGYSADSGNLLPTAKQKKALSAGYLKEIGEKP